MIGRNVDDHFAKTPTPHYPRSRFDMGIHKRLQTQGHGKLYPFFARMVYPGDTWQMDCSTFVRMDTSKRVPLDDIYLDTYWFFVPLRIIDTNFPKILGEGEPEDYDDVSYGFPSIGISTTDSYGEDFILPYLGYSQASATTGVGGYAFDYADHFCPYPMMAYYKVINDWFRDENVDPSIPYGDLMTYTDLGQSGLYDNALFEGFNAYPVNKFHDYFSSSVIAPQKGPAVTIPLGTSAPVGGNATATATLANASNASLAAGTSVVDGTFYQLAGSAASGFGNTPIYADLSQAAGTINELRLAFAIQELYEKRGRFGTRYIETLRGQWGLDVPDMFLQRPEYLGGNRVTLNNVPVLSTENSSQLGQMAGNSATLSNGGSWTKTFVDYGILLGVSCTRIKHSFTQGVRRELFRLKTQLDLYNPVFANIGFQPVMQDAIYNKGDDSTLGNADTVFAYQEAWAELRSDVDSFAGQFGVLSTNSDLKNYWHYGDYYATAPVFDSQWLKEPASNISRTLTGQLITGSTNPGGHKFMFGYYYHPIVTRILPSYSIPAGLYSRL